MYATRNEVVNKYQQFRHMVAVVLPSYEARHAGNTGRLALEIMRELDDMEAAGTTMVQGVEAAGSVESAVAYLDHHYTGAPKPEWYRNLTE